MNRTIKLIVASFATMLMIPAIAIAAHETKSTVTLANTQGFVFNGDSRNKTPFEFTEAQKSIGKGSLFVKPIGTTAADKFTAEKLIGAPVSNMKTVSYDFLIDGIRTPADAAQFYMNVYANFGDSLPTKFYDCRYNVIPVTGSTTAFTSVSFNAAQATAVTTRTNVDPVKASPRPCPASLAGMQALSPSGTTAVVRSIVLNVGDTTTSDTGVAGYYDKVVIATTNSTVTYDFELRNMPTNANQCKNNGFESATNNDGEVFKNQGQCVRFVNANRTKNVNTIQIINTTGQSASSGNASNGTDSGGGNATSGAASNANRNSVTTTINN